MVNDLKHQCDFEGCWCKREKPNSLNDIVIELGAVKRRLDDSYGLLARMNNRMEKEYRNRDYKKRNKPNRQMADAMGKAGVKE